MASMAADPLIHLLIAFHFTIYPTVSRIVFFLARKHVLKHWCRISWRFWERMGVDRRSLQWSTGVHQWSPVWWLFISLFRWKAHRHNGRYIMKCLLEWISNFLLANFLFFSFSLLRYNYMPIKQNLLYIQGGAWVSTGDEASRFARFAFRRHFFQHLGFRVACSMDSDEKTDLPVRLVTDNVFVLGVEILGNKHQWLIWSFVI